MDKKYLRCAHCAQTIRVIDKKRGKHLIVCPGSGYSTYVEIDENGNMKIIKN